MMLRIVSEIPSSDVSRDQLHLVQHFGECRELIAIQDFVEYLLAGGGVVNPVVVFIRVAMEVVVLQ